MIGTKKRCSWLVGAGALACIPLIIGCSSSQLGALGTRSILNADSRPLVDGMLAVDVGKHNCKVHAITISNGEGALKSYACDGYHALFHYPSNEAPAGAQVALGLQVNPNPPPPPPPSGQLLVSLYFSSAELIDFTKQQPKIKAQFSSTTFSSSAKYSLYEYYYMANQKFVELPGSPVSVGNAVGELLRFTSPLLGIRIDSSQGFVVELVQN